MGHNGKAHLRAEDIVNTVRESLVILDEQMRVLSANTSFYNKFQVGPEETEGHLIYDLGNGQWNIPELHTLLEETIPKQSTFNDFLVHHWFQSIGDKVMLFNGRKVTFEDGQSSQILLAIDDITGTYEAQQNVKESEEKYRKFVENLNSIIIGFNRNGVITFFNRFSEKLFGYSRDEIIGKTFVGTIIPCADASGNSTASICQDIFAHPEKFYSNENEGVCKDGSRIWFSWSARAVRDKSGEINEILIDGNDITKFHTMRKKSEEDAAVLETILESIPVGIMVTDKDDVIQNASRSLGVIFNQPIEKLLHTNEKERLEYLDICFPDGTKVQPDGLPLSKSIITGEQFDNYETILKTDGTSKVLFTHSRPVRDKKGNITGAIGIWQDVTEQINREREHERQRMLLEQIIQEVPVGIALHEGPEFITTIVNKGYYSFAYGKGDVQGKPVEDIWPEIGDQILPLMRNVVASGIPYHADDREFTIIRDKGPEKAWFSFSFLPFYGEKNCVTGVLVWCIETTRYIQNQKEIELSRELVNRQRTFFEKVLTNARVAIAVFKGPELKITYVNPTYQAISPDVIMVGRLYHEVFPDASEAGAKQKMLHVLSTGEPWIIQKYPAPVPGKPDAVWEGQIVRIDPNPDEYEPSLLSIVWDTTEAAYAEEQLKQATSRFALLAYTANELLQAPEPDKLMHELLTRVMRQLDCQMFLSYHVDPDTGKLSLHTCKGIPSEHAHNIESLQFGEGVCGYAAKTGVMYKVENIQEVTLPGKQCEDLKELGFNSFASFPLKIKGGKVIGTISFGKKRKKPFKVDDEVLMQAIADQMAIAMNRLIDERTLKKSEKKFRAIFEQAAVGIGLVSLRDSKWISVNKAFCEMLEYTAEEFKTTPWPDITHPDDLHLDLIQFKKMTDGEVDSYSVEKRFIHNKGYFVWARLTLSLVRNDQGNPDYEIAIIEDIDESKKAEDALRDSEHEAQQRRAEIEAVMHAIPIGLAVYDKNGKIVRTNEYFKHTLSYTDELIKLDAYTRMKSRKYFDESGKLIPTEQNPVFLALNGQAIRDKILRIQLSAGGERWINLSASPFWIDSKFAGAVAGLIDITHSKRAEFELRESEEHFRTLADNIVQFAWMADYKGKIFWYNKRWYEYTGTTEEEMIGVGWKKVCHPDHIDSVITSIQRSWDTGEPWEEIFPIRAKDGMYGWFLSRAVPIRNEKNEIVRWFGTNTDITEIRELQNDLQKRTNELADANKDLESFSYSVAHDLRNPLNSIKGLIEFLNEDCSDRLDDDCKEYITRIIEGANRMNSIIEDMLALSKISRQEMEKTVIDLSLMAKSTIDELRKSQPDRIIEVIIKEGLGVYADARLMSVALGNLLGNAWKYTGKTKHPRIEFGSFQSDKKEIYYVKDNGAGFDMKKAGDLFIPFKRLHSEREFKGTGVGLAIVERAISRHGGKVWAEGNVGEGAIFYFILG